MKKVFTGIFLLAFSFSIHSVYAQTVTVEQKAKIFWQGFVNSYKKNNKVNVDKFDPDGVKVDWPIAMNSNVFSDEDEGLIEVITYEDYYNQKIDNDNYWKKINYKNSIAEILYRGKSIKVFKFDKQVDLICDRHKVSFTNFFNSKYGDTSDIYLLTNRNSNENEVEHYDYFVTLLKYDGRTFKIAAIYRNSERGD
jgi:hypothetical protein